MLLSWKSCAAGWKGRDRSRNIRSVARSQSHPPRLRPLSRIHHYTLKRLRAEIEPVAGRDFVRFLLEWQKVAADARMEGPEAVDKIIAQLEGFEAAAGAWETEILPARLAGYEPVWL